MAEQHKSQTPENPLAKKAPPYYFLFLSYGLNIEFENRSMNTRGCQWRLGWLARSCVQGKRKSSYDLIRNCLNFKEWSHLGLNQGLPDYESGALTN